MAGGNIPGLGNVSGMFSQLQNQSPVAPSYQGSGRYNQMAWNSSPLSRSNPYSNPNMQPRGAWHGGGYGGNQRGGQGGGYGFGGFGGSVGGGGFNGGPLTPTPPPTTPFTGGPQGYIPKKGGGFNHLRQSMGSGGWQPPQGFGGGFGQNSTPGMVHQTDVESQRARAQQTRQPSRFSGMSEMGMRAFR